MQFPYPVARHVQLDEDVQALEGLAMHLLDGAVAQIHLVHIRQAGEEELLAPQLGYLVVGKVQHLHLVAHVQRYLRKRLVLAVCALLARVPVAVAGAAALHPVGRGRYQGQ